MANLGKALSKQHIVSIINELPESKSISVYISRSKALVCHVKVWQLVSQFPQGAEFLAVDST